jgi:hypothetical protein
VCDDGERVDLTDKVYGASLVTVLRALNNEGRLDAMNFPSLETTLRLATEWGLMMKEMSYTPPYYLVCKVIGKRLFRHKSKHVLALEKARLAEWVSSHDADERRLLKKNIRKERRDAVAAAEEGRVQKRWYSGAGDFDEDEKDRDFVLSGVWKKYKDYLRNVPKEPLEGPPEWDLKKWTVLEMLPFVSEYLLSDSDDFDSESDGTDSDDFDSEDDISY